MVGRPVSRLDPLFNKQRRSPVMNWFASVACLMGLIGAGLSPAFAEPGPVAGGRLEIDPQGQIVVLEWSERSQALSEPVRQAIEAQLRGRTWRPSGAHPEAQRFGSPFSVETVLEEKGDELLLRVARLHVGPEYRKLRPPRFPPEGLRWRQQADLLARVEIDEQGRATSVDIATEPTERDVFVEAVREAIRGWHFSNQTVDGVPVAGALNIPLRFSIQCIRGADAFELDAPAPGGVIEVVGGANTASLIEVTGSRSMRGPKPCEPKGAEEPNGEPLAD